jgi:excisionase family DNA binding protein
MARAELRLLDRRPTISDGISPGPALGQAVLDELLAQLADLVAAKVAARLAAPQPDVADEWLDTRHAAEYLGIHRDSVRRLAAERVIPSEQAGAGCKLFFRRSDLNAWRRHGSASFVSIRSRRDG